MEKEIKKDNKKTKKGIQITYMDMKYNVIAEDTYEECTDEDQMYLFVQSIIKQILLIEATSIKVVHRLTTSELSKDDVAIAKQFVLILPNIGVELKDYVMVTKNSYFSLIEQGLAKKLMIIWLR